MYVTVESIEDAILKTLKQDQKLASYVKRFMILPDLSEDYIARLVKSFPTIAVVGYEGYWKEITTVYQDETGLFAVLCVNKNLRSPEAAIRRGKHAEVGLYDIVEDVRRTLSKHNAVQVQGVIDCCPKRRKLLRADGALAIYSVEVEISWRRDVISG